MPPSLLPLISAAPTGGAARRARRIGVRRSRPFDGGFTLVELLVVIAVIGILVSILIPVLGKARRKAIVLACPIAFHTWDDDAIHLTDPQGKFDLDVTGSLGKFHERRPSAPMWSPSGLRLGYELSNWPVNPRNPPQFMCVLDPMAGRVTNIPQLRAQPRSYWRGWVDEEHFFENADAQFYVRDAAGGTVTQQLGYSPLSDALLYPCPRNLPGKWVTIVNGVVRYVRADFSLGKVIWATTAADAWRPYASDDSPMDVDPMGEWIAWTESGRGGPRTAIKQTAAPPNMPPTYLTPLTPGFQFPLGTFAAWTDDGNLLFCTGSGMAIVNKDGDLVRPIPLESRTISGRASWRRYGHP